MKLSEEQLNEIYADKRNRHLSLFLGACEREIVNDEWGRPLNMSHQYLSDQEVLDLVEWWKKKQSEQKYTVKVLGDDGAFLIKTPNGSFYFGTLSTANAYGDQNGFTQAEIKKLKQRDDLAIDWDKAIIEPV